jgi:hypothetical protein
MDIPKANNGSTSINCMDRELQLLGGIQKERVLKATPQQHYTNSQSVSFFFLYLIIMWRHLAVPNAN